MERNVLEAAAPRVLLLETAVPPFCLLWRLTCQRKSQHAHGPYASGLASPLQLSEKAMESATEDRPFLEIVTSLGRREEN